MDELLDRQTLDVFAEHRAVFRGSNLDERVYPRHLAVVPGVKGGASLVLRYSMRPRPEFRYQRRCFRRSQPCSYFQYDALLSQISICGDRPPVSATSSRHAEPAPSGARPRDDGQGYVAATSASIRCSSSDPLDQALTDERVPRLVEDPVAVRAVRDCSVRDEKGYFGWIG
jgi:hypothetical protein